VTMGLQRSSSFGSVRRREVRYVHARPTPRLLFNDFENNSRRPAAVILQIGTWRWREVRGKAD
jgi:hypothetical protein